MEEKLNRLITPEDCQKASFLSKNALRLLEEFDIEEYQDYVDWWLEEFEYLYELLSNKPPGLPAIPRTTCDGILYPALSEFWRRYHRLSFPIKDNDESNSEEDG